MIARRLGASLRLARGSRRLEFARDRAVADRLTVLAGNRNELVDEAARFLRQILGTVRRHGDPQTGHQPIRQIGPKRFLSCAAVVAREELEESPLVAAPV